MVFSKVSFRPFGVMTCTSWGPLLIICFYITGLSLSADDLASSQNPFFVDMGIEESQKDNVERLERIRLPADWEAEVFPNPPAPSSGYYRPNTFSHGPSSLAHIPAGLDHSSLETRVDYILSAIRNAGFPTLDAFMSSFYTASFQDQSSAQKAQEISHSKGLPIMLDELRVKSSDWPIWQSRAYTDSIVRSAANIIADELDRLVKKRYQCENVLQQGLFSHYQMATLAPARSSSIQQLHIAAAELRKTLQNEVAVCHISIELRYD